MPMSSLAHVERALTRQRNSDKFCVDPAARMHGFPRVRWWDGPNYNAWGPSVEYTHTDSKGDRYAINFQGNDFNNVRCWVVYLTGHMVETPILCLPGTNPWDIANLRTFAWHKRRLHLIITYRRRRAAMNHNIVQRFYSYARGSSDFPVLQARHAQLHDKVAAIYAYEKEEDPGSEMTLGWLRLLRHIRKDTGLIAYTKDDVEALDGVVSWPRYDGYPRKSRNKGKMSRVMAAAGISDHVTGLMYQKWAAMHKNNYKVTEVTGTAIQNAYVNHVGCSSCMTGDEEIIEMYTCNPEKIRMLLLELDGQTVGRALLWYMDDNPRATDNRYWDRPYPQSDKVSALYARYAKDNGIEYGYTMDGLPRDAQCTIKAPDNMALAYQDSWCSMTPEGDHWVMARNGKYDTGSTEGGPLYNEESRVYCTHCDSRMLEDDAHLIGWDFWCDDCYADHWFTCEHCSDACNNVDEMIVDGVSWCEGCYSAEAATCESCEEVTSATLVQAEDGLICPTCASERVECFNNCGTRVKRDTKHEHDGQLYCADCHADATGDDQ